MPPFAGLGNIELMERRGLSDLLTLVRKLRSPGGCPWDRARPLEDVLSSLVDECYEALWARQRGRNEELLDELGDILFLLVFALGILAEGDPRATIEELATRSHSKITRRHPHVFGGEKAESIEESLAHWNRAKEKEKEAEGRAGTLGRWEGNLPPLRKAEKVQRRAAAVGFDWDDALGIVEKLREELDEVERCLRAGAGSELREEVGDLMFTVVNLIRFLEMDAEAVLASAVVKFIDRFGKMEALMAAEGRKLGELGIEELDRYWERAKEV